jgi:hypothetical protein
MDTLLFFLSVFYVNFSSLYGIHSSFLLVHLFLTHPGQHTDNTDLFPAPSSLLFRYRGYRFIFFVWTHIEVASVAPGVCSRLPFCISKHAEQPIRRVRSMKNTLINFSFTHYKL